jgi:hypothetical protein
VSHLLDQGVPGHEVKELARHADIQTTMTYVKAQEERLREAAGKMAVGRANLLRIGGTVRQRPTRVEQIC